MIAHALAPLLLALAAPGPTDRAPEVAVLEIAPQPTGATDPDHPPPLGLEPPLEPAGRPLVTRPTTQRPDRPYRRAARLPHQLRAFPYGWVRADATYYSAAREGYSNLDLAGARAGGGVEAGPLTAFVTIEAAAAKGPQLFDAFVSWRIFRRNERHLSLRAGQFKAPFGYRFNAPDLVDELSRAPISMHAANPGRQTGLELTLAPWRQLQGVIAAFSGIGQNRGANNTKLAFAAKLQLTPFAARPSWPQLLLVASAFTYTKTNGFSPGVETTLEFEFYRGIPATGPARRLTAGGALFWRYLSARGEFFYTYDARERDTDGDPFTPGDPLAPMIGAGGYAQLAAVLTGQAKDPATLLPKLRGAQLRDSAVELAARYDRFQVGARDLPGNGVSAASLGLNWILLRHLRIFVSAHHQRLDTAAPEIPRAASWGVTGGLAGFFLGRVGLGD